MNLSNTQKSWLDNNFWPTPSWLEQDQVALNLRSYDDYFLYQLRVKYLDLETDFRLTLQQNINDQGFQEHAISFAERIIDMLQFSKKGLESNDKNINHLMNVSYTLGLIDKYMIWVYDEHKVEYNFKLLQEEAKASHPELVQLLNDTMESVGNEGQIANASMREAYVTAMSVANREAIQKEISFGLQIERLKTLIKGGLITVFIIIAASPLLMNDLGEMLPPGLEAFSQGSWVSTWLPVLGVTLIGALGGFFSGLLQVKSNKVALAEYKESQLKFQLKPIVGALTATLLFLLLSWQILPGITIENFGSLLFIAFVSGFSERYFLNLLNIDEVTGSSGIRFETEQSPGNA